MGLLALAGCHRVFGLDPEPEPALVTWSSDDDGDGFNAEHAGTEVPADLVIAARDGDCHDDDPTAFPGSTARETPNDGIDTDCDGLDACTDLNCDGLPDVAVPLFYDGDYEVLQPARLLSGPDGLAFEPTPTQTRATTGQVILDLDKDGYLDIVHASNRAAAGYAAESYIYWGRTDHAQATRSALPTSGANRVCAADLDGNGWVDLVFANYVSDTTGYATDSFIYWNRVGQFSPLDRLALPTIGAAGCAIEDLDGDGFLDIAFAGYTSGATTAPSYATTSFIYWGSATHDYPTASRTEVPTVGTNNLSVADLDGDAQPELVFWSHYDGTAYASSQTTILWNHGDRYADVERTQLEGMGPLTGAIADLDKDGYPDIIVPGFYAGAWTTPATTYIYWGNAARTYSAADRTGLTAYGAVEAVVADVDGDGHLEVILPSYFDGNSSTSLSIFWGSSRGTYSNAERLLLPSQGSYQGTAVADFDHDGHMDIFVPAYHNNITGADLDPWANQAYSRIYYGGPQGPSPSSYKEWPTRGAWGPRVVGR